MDKAWLDISKLALVAGFENLLEAMREHSLLWRAWIENDAPEEMSYPPPYTDEESLTPFQRLMLLRFVMSHVTMLSV